MLSTMPIEATSPIPSRSSGTKPMRMPSLMISAGVLPRISSPLKVMCPLSALMSPAIVSQSSFCPLPATPATPRISPVRTAKEILSMAREPSGFLTCRSLISMTVWGSTGSGRLIERLIGRPTISSVSFRASVSAVFTVSMLFPFQRMVTRSLSSSTYWSLLVNLMISKPS